MELSEFNSQAIIFDLPLRFLFISSFSGEILLFNFVVAEWRAKSDPRTRSNSIGLRLHYFINVDDFNPWLGIDRFKDIKWALVKK